MYCTNFLILIWPLLFISIEMWDKNLLHTKCVGTRLCIRSCLLCELTTSLLVASMTHSDTGSHNRLDLIQNLVPTHYVCNGYFSVTSCVWPIIFCIIVSWLILTVSLGEIKGKMSKLTINRYKITENGQFYSVSEFQWLK